MTNNCNGTQAWLAAAEASKNVILEIPTAVGLGVSVLAKMSNVGEYCLDTSPLVYVCVRKI